MWKNYRVCDYWLFENLAVEESSKYVGKRLFYVGVVYLEDRFCQVPQIPISFAYVFYITN